MDYFKGSVDFVDDWYLMGSPFPIIAIWIMYITFVLKWGPAYMSTRSPYKLNDTLALYNLFQVGLSLYILYTGISIMWHDGVVSSHCAIEDKTRQEYILRGVYTYVLAKVSELFDTVFFVLRKKTNQITFLHVYHHSLMAISSWLALKYNPTDIVIFLGTINSFVHVIMYAYYGLSAYPSLAKYLWWKKYITSMQLIQFGLITIQAVTASIISSCATSFVLLITIFFNLGLMIYLFRDFYIKTYVKNDTVKSKTVLDDTKSKSFVTNGGNLRSQRYKST